MSIGRVLAGVAVSGCLLTAGSTAGSGKDPVVEELSLLCLPLGLDFDPQNADAKPAAEPS